jgi:ribosomal protein S18 acetylase RimI-like enzyme
VALEPFALTRVESARLSRSLASGSSGRLSAHRAGPDDDAALLSLQLTGSVFLEAFGNTPELLHREYAGLLPSMTHVVVLDKVAQAPVGALILQEAPAAELKTLVDLTAPPWSTGVSASLAALHLAPDDRTAADLLVMAVDGAFRNRGIAQLLMYAGWVASVARGIDRWTAILDDGLLRGLDQLTAGAVVPIGSARSAPYLGSAGSTPITVRMHPDRDGDLLSRMQRVGRLVARTTTFCPRLEPDRVAFQALREPSIAVA